MTNNYNDDKRKIQECLSCTMSKCMMYSDNCRVKQITREEIEREYERKKANKQH